MEVRDCCLYIALLQDEKMTTTDELLLPGLAIALSLLPTPTAMDSRASGGSTPSDVTLTDAVVRTSLGATTNPRFGDGRQSWDVPPLLPPSPEPKGSLDSAPGSSNGCKDCPTGGSVTSPD